MKQIRIFYDIIRNVEHDVNDFLRRCDGEIVDIKIVPTRYNYDTKVMVIYDEKEEASC